MTSRGNPVARQSRTTAAIGSSSFNAGMITEIIRDPLLHPMNNTFAPKNVRGFAEIIADIGLLPDPIEITANARGQIDLRRVAGSANSLGVAGEMTHFTGPKFRVHFGRDMDIERVGDLFRDSANADAGAAPNIDRQAVQLVRFSGKQIGARYVLYE